MPRTVTPPSTAMIAANAVREASELHGKRQFRLLSAKGAHVSIHLDDEKRINPVLTDQELAIFSKHSLVYSHWDWADMVMDKESDGRSAPGIVLYFRKMPGQRLPLRKSSETIDLRAEGERTQSMSAS